MFENSKDILYIVISFCIIWVTVFLCWMFYYAGKILKDTSQIIEEFRTRLKTLAESISYIQEKIDFMSMGFSSLFKSTMPVVKEVITKKAKSWMDDCEAKKVGKQAKDAVEKAMRDI